MPYAIEMKSITKTFGSLVANDQITLQVKKGEIHALLGENGAGKSTLMSILFGLYQPDSGEIWIDGNLAKIHNPNDANALKIGMVHQHFKLVDVFSVTENIILGMETLKNGVIDRVQCRKDVLAISEKYGLHIDPDALIKDITVGMRQRVEILKMLYRNADMLIFDEPTGVLSPLEIEELMKIIKGFAAKGKTIILISHKLDEIMEVADTCTVLRRGKHIGTVAVKDTSMEQLAEMMVGRKVSLRAERLPISVGQPLLSVDHLFVHDSIHEKDVVKDVTFEVKEGEIVCIAGVEGNGQSQLVKAITGLMPLKSGHLKFLGKDITSASVREKNELGLAHIPEDRQYHGLVLDFTLEENIVLNSYQEEPFSKKGILQHPKINEYANQLIKDFDIRSSEGATSLTRGMSGGNQQKVILAREISHQPKLIVAVQPTRGLDVGAIEYIHKQLINHRNKKGNAVLLMSLELEEIMAISDRILVMYKGELVANLQTEKTNLTELGQYMLGIKRGEGYENKH